MKKSILLLLSTLGMATAGHAQGVRLGVKAGASFTSFSGQDARGLGSKLGAHAGVLAELGLTDNVALQPELLFSMKGARFKDLADPPQFNLTYLDVPVLLKVRAEGLFFEAGPQVGVLMDANLKDDNSAISVSNAYRKVDVGYVAGLGYEWKAGPMIGLRYNGGLTKVGKSYSANGVEVDAPNRRNSAFQLYLGFLFGSR